MMTDITELLTSFHRLLGATMYIYQNIWSLQVGEVVTTASQWDGLHDRKSIAYSTEIN